MPRASWVWSADVTVRSLLQELRFSEERIHVEQLRLLLVNAVSSTLPVVLLSLLMTHALITGQNRDVLLGWFAAVVVVKLLSFLVARHYLSSPIPPEYGHRLAWLMIGLYTLSGLSWGALPWLTLESATTAGRVFVLSVMAGVVGSALAQTSSVLAVFVAFAFSTLSLVGIKLLLLDDPAYIAFAIATAIYFFSLLSLSRNNAAASLAAIRLGFENSDLLAQLRRETEQAEAARRDAEHANMAKSKFLAAASHDLRQPVHAQGLFLSVLAGTPLNAQQRELVDNIRQSSQASSEMLGTLLDFSRIEAGVVKPDFRALSLMPLMNKLEAELAPLADAKGLIYRTRETELSVTSDPSLLELVLRNLITNAIRYTEQGGVLVGARRRAGQVQLEVWDSGIGIEPEQQQEIFREFHQLGNPERDSSKGLGLGLAIADGMAGVLGHGLSLHSRPGCGSVFRLSMQQARGAVLDASVSALQPPCSALKLRILVIDDEQSVRRGMLHLLQDWGCDCRTAEGIEEALQDVQEWLPDVIISDYRLREQRTGSEAIAALRERLRYPVPALLITGDTAPQRLREAQESGVPLLHKPVSPSQLYQQLLLITQNGAGCSRAAAR